MRLKPNHEPATIAVADDLGQRRGDHVHTSESESQHLPLLLLLRTDHDRADRPKPMRIADFLHLELSSNRHQRLIERADSDQQLKRLCRVAAMLAGTRIP